MARSDVRFVYHPTRGQFGEVEALEARCYSSEYITPADEAYAWYRALPYTTVMAQSAGRIVGALDMFPVKDGVYRALRAGRFNDKYLVADDVVDVGACLRRSVGRPGEEDRAQTPPHFGARPRPDCRIAACPLRGEASDSRLAMFLSCIVVDERFRGGVLVPQLLAAAVGRFDRIEVCTGPVVIDNVTAAGERFSQRYGFSFVCDSDHGSRVYEQDYAAFARRVREACAGMPGRGGSLLP